MAEKRYRIWLNDHTYVVVEFFVYNGRVVSFVVRLSGVFEDADKCIARYDTAHGCPHLDLVNTHGKLLEKKWLLGMTLEEALRYAIDDFKANHESYVANFKK
jgi:hypothetical protein